MKKTYKILMIYLLLCTTMVSMGRIDELCIQQSIEKILSGGEIYLPEECHIYINTKLHITGNVRIFGENSFLYSAGATSLFQIEENASLEIYGITISGLNNTDNRNIEISYAAIQNYGNLVLNNVSIMDNIAYRSLGVGLFNAVGAKATITNSRMTNNSGVGSRGGGIYNSGIMDITNSEFDNNNVTFQGEISSDPFHDTHGDGGGIYNTGAMTITDSLIHHNKSNFAGGIYNKGDLQIIGSEVNENEAVIYKNRGWRGGISNNGTLIIKNSVIYGNKSMYEGGGIWNGGTIVVENSNIYNNRVQQPSRRCEGSGFFNTPNFLTTVTDVTLQNNYWGASDGPSGLGNGHGDEICGSNIKEEDYSPWSEIPFFKQ